MIQKIETPDNSCELSGDYKNSLYSELKKYNYRYAVLMDEIVIQDRFNKHVKYRFDKGTLVQVQILERPEIFKGISISGVVNNRIKRFTIYERSYDILKGEILEKIPEPRDFEKTLKAYSGEVILDYIKQHFGFAEELDQECAQMTKLSKSAREDFDLQILFSIISALLGIVVFIPVGITVNPIMGIMLFIFAIWLIIRAFGSKIKLAKQWKIMDEQTTHIVALIESGRNDTNAIEDVRLLSPLSPLIQCNDEPVIPNT